MRKKSTAKKKQVSAPKKKAPQSAKKQPRQKLRHDAVSSFDELPADELHVAELQQVEPEKGRTHNYVPRSIRRRHLDNRLKALYHRAMVLEKALLQLDDNRFYRTCIFGSARIKPDSKAYNDVFMLARLLSWEGIDILTGGGPGLMEAANKGAQLGQEEKKTKTLSFGLSIQLDFEPEPNKHLDVKRHHHKFSSRLDDFMRLSHSIVVTPGGIGTILELFFTWQLIQVRHIAPRPIVLMDRAFWQGLIAWMREFPLTRTLVSAKDFDGISIVDSPEEAARLISAHYHQYRKSNSK